MNRNYSTRIWKDGRGHWCLVLDAQRRQVARVWTPGGKSVAQQEGRDAIARDLSKLELAGVETARAA